MNEKMFVICGETNTGKSTIAKEMENMGIKRVVTYTTRKPRKKEINGIDYHFISEKEFLEKKANGFFAETASYEKATEGCVYYGSAKEDYLLGGVIILNPIGIRQVKDFLNTINAPVYKLSLPEDTLRMRAIKRGDAFSEIERRLAADRIDFSKDFCDEYVDIIVCCENKTPTEIAKIIINN